MHRHEGAADDAHCLVRVQLLWTVVGVLLLQPPFYAHDRGGSLQERGLKRRTRDHSDGGLERVPWQLCRCKPSEWHPMRAAERIGHVHRTQFAVEIGARGAQSGIEGIAAEHGRDEGRSLSIDFHRGYSVSPI